MIMAMYHGHGHAHVHAHVHANVKFVALSRPVQGGIVTLILNRSMHLNRTKTDTMLKDGVWTSLILKYAHEPS